MSVPQKIVLKSTTKISLNDRFTKLQATKQPPPVQVQHVRANMVAQQQASIRNQRLAQQMSNRPALQAAAFKLKKKSLQQRLGSNVKSRLTLGPRGGGRGVARGRGFGGRGRGRGLQTQTSVYSDGSASSWGQPRGGRGMRSRGLSRGGFGGRGNTRGLRGNSRGRGVMNNSRGSGRGFVRGGRYNDGGDWRGRWGRSFRGGRGGFRGRDMGSGRGGSDQGGRGGGRFARGGRGRGRGVGRGMANGRGRGGPQKNMTKEQLDSQLDEYMSKTKGFLDAELDAYMASAEVV